MGVPRRIDYPFIIRPLDSHAGKSLAKIENRNELATYLERTAGGEFVVSPFVDYRSRDGLLIACYE